MFQERSPLLKRASTVSQSRTAVRTASFHLSTMRLLLAVILLLGATLAEESAFKADCNCGWTNSGRIVGGKETGKNQYPWMVGMYHCPSRQLLCSASIITEYHALTAAHCIVGSPSEYNLLVGAHQSNWQKGKMIAVSKMIAHELYDANLAPYDIGMIVTTTKITFSQTVGPACLPRRRIQLEGKKIKALGWGYTKENVWKISDVLREVEMEVIPIKECKKYWKKGELTKKQTQLCTEQPGTSTCYGDSGGPILYMNPDINRYQLIAITSFGDKCMTPPPVVHTEIAKYLLWIEKTIRETKPGVQACQRKKPF